MPKEFTQDGLKEARGAGVGLVQDGFKGSLNLMQDGFKGSLNLMWEFQLIWRIKTSFNYEFPLLKIKVI